MPSPRTIGTVTDTGGNPVPVITGGGFIALDDIWLAPDQADDLAGLLITAFWQAMAEVHGG